MIKPGVTQLGAANLLARINPFSFLYARGNGREYLYRAEFILPAIYITPSGDLNNNPIRSDVVALRKFTFRLRACFAGTKQICEIAFPRVRGMRGRDVRGGLGTGLEDKAVGTVRDNNDLRQVIS